MELPKILLVGVDNDLERIVASSYETTSVKTLEACSPLAKSKWNATIMNLRTPVTRNDAPSFDAGLSFYKVFRGAVDAPIIMITDPEDSKHHEYLWTLRPFDIIGKNVGPNELKSKLEKAVIFSINEIDLLTGLYKEVPFMNRYLREYHDVIKRRERKARGRRISDVTLSLVYYDIDGFKETNDTLGHAKGDLVLREFGRVLTHQRAGDLSVRWHGDEFGLLVHGDQQAAAIAAYRTCMAFNDFPFEFLLQTESKDMPDIKVSAGICSLYVPGVDKPEDLVHMADLAMFESKEYNKAHRHTPNNFTVFGYDMKGQFKKFDLHSKDIEPVRR